MNKKQYQVNNLKSRKDSFSKARKIDNGQKFFFGCKKCKLRNAFFWRKKNSENAGALFGNDGSDLEFARLRILTKSLANISTLEVKVFFKCVVKRCPFYILFPSSDMDFNF